MRLTKFTDLALRAVMRLAVIPQDESVTTREVAESMDVPYAHMAKVVTRLQHLGVIEARRGRGGGLALTELGRRSSVGWLTRTLEGEEEVVGCEGDPPCPLRTASPATGCAARGAGGVLPGARPADRGGARRLADGPTAPLAHSTPLP